MKLILSEPCKNEDGMICIKTKALFKSYLYFHDWFIGEDIKFYWNSFYKNYDITIGDGYKYGNYSKDRDIKLEALADWLQKEFKCHLSEWYYDYQIDRRQKSAFRIWIYPNKE